MLHLLPNVILLAEVIDDALGIVLRVALPDVTILLTYVPEIVACTLKVPAIEKLPVPSEL